MSLAIGFVLGNVLVFCVANAVYVHFTNLPQGMHHGLVAWLTVAMSWAAAVGAMITDRSAGRTATPVGSVRGGLAHTSAAVIVTGAAYFGIAALRLSTGHLNARWQLSNDQDFGAAYVANGVTAATCVFFFLLGVRLPGSLTSPHALLTLAIVGVSALVEALGGGREFSLWIGLVFLVGAAASELRRTAFTALVIGSFVVGVALMGAVGSARTRSDFAFSSAETRITAIGDAAVDASRPSDDGAALEPVVSRVYEFSAQHVIDYCATLSCAGGFEHFERLQHVFLPKFLVPEKIGADDGTEVLIRDFGYQLGDYTAVPITLVADGFRRGGWLWVIVVGLLAGVWLRVLAAITLRTMGADFGVVTVTLLALMQVRGYTRSVPDYIALVTYESLKQLVIVSALVAVASWLSRDRIGGTRARLPAS